MPEIFVTSDLHLNNENIIKYSNRPYRDAAHQTEELIKNWNSVVSPADEVIVLGDFILGNPETIHTLLPRFNGHITLCRGNHDTQAKLDIYAQYSEKITVKDIHFIPYKGLYFVCCHFPMPEIMLEMIRTDNSEITPLFGHVHDHLPFQIEGEHAFNCCTEVTNYTPVKLHHLWNIVRGK